MPVTFGVTRARGIDGAQCRRPAFQCRTANDSNIVHIRRQFGDDGHVYCVADGSDDLSDHLGILAHRHAVPLGMRTGKVELQTVSHGSELLRHGNKLLNGPAKDRDQQKAICRNCEAAEALERCLDPGVGQANGIDERAGCVLAVDGLPIAKSRLKPDALGGDDADFGHGVHDPLDNGGCCRHDARGNGEGA